MLHSISFNIYNAGAPRQPKWGHLQELHKAIKLCEEAMVATDPKNTTLGHNVEVKCLYSHSSLSVFELAVRLFHH